MAIRPLDMQVMLPKMQEVANMRQTEHQRGNVNQNSIASSNEKQITHNQQSVVKSHEDQKSEQQADAKEEGKNKYGYKSPKKKQQDKENEPPEGTSYHKIDIKI